MPKADYVNEQTAMTALSSYYFTLIYITSLATFVTNVVSEKEKKIKGILKVYFFKTNRK